MLSSVIKGKISKQFGHQLRYPSDCEALALDIERVTHCHIGVTTLKRLLGYIGGVSMPRQSTLDIIAYYLNYDCYDSLIADISKECGSSEFNEVDEVLSSDLSVGQSVAITYAPNRNIEMSYQGNNMYLITRAVNSKLQTGDKVMITGLIKGYPLVVKMVVRDGVSMGGYIGAKLSGLTSIVAYGV